VLSAPIRFVTADPQAAKVAGPIARGYGLVMTPCAKVVLVRPAMALRIEAKICMMTIRSCLRVKIRRFEQRVGSAGIYVSIQDRSGISFSIL
jgi:hypothetical protein